MQQKVSKKEFKEVMAQSIQLKQCVKCHYSGEIKIKMPFFGANGAHVQCIKCRHSTRLYSINAYYVTDDDGGSFGTPTTEESMINGVKQAIEEWNNPELQKIKTVLNAKNYDYAGRIIKEQFEGDCLKGIGIPDVGTAVVDTEAVPEVGDVVHCTDKLFTALGGLLKQVRSMGETVMVGTCYEDSTKDIEFEAFKIYGVVLEVLNADNQVVWSKK